MTFGASKKKPIYAQVDAGIKDSRGELAATTDVDRTSRINPYDKWASIYDHCEVEVCGLDS